MAEQLSDNVRNGGGLFPHSSILLLKLLLTTFSLALPFHLPLAISGQREFVVWKSLLAMMGDPHGDPHGPAIVMGAPVQPSAPPVTLRVQGFLQQPPHVL